MTLIECEAPTHGLELNARAADMLARMVFEEYRSAKSEADVSAAQRLQVGLESQISVESIRGAAVDSEMCLVQELQFARVEMHTPKGRTEIESNTRLESVATLQELLKQLQEAWRNVDAEL